MGVRVASVHPGRILQCFDHFVIDLRGEGRQAAYFTVYAVEYSPELCPNTDAVLARMVCVAVTPRLGDEDVREIGEAIAKVWAALPQA